MIRVEGLGKKYVLGRNRSSERYTALRDVFANMAKAPLRRWRNGAARAEAAEDEEFWALRDVNFEVRRGDVVGIIGRNGAGKSTLLKVLSRITEPTTGRVSLRGRVASLLEVGTGFHPELTGRENIFLNGAILGMHRSEIRTKFDEIVAFAEVEKFLDTPVKRYSSGMYVRLAFAVAAHLEPEILIVDEVLAVGDAEFQRKCLGKMQDVAKGEGRTVLFVSHNMAAVAQLCGWCIVLAHGCAREFSSVEKAISLYLHTQDDRLSLDVLSRNYRHIAGVQIVNDSLPSEVDESAAAEVFFGEPLQIVVKLHRLPRDVPIGVNISFRNAEGRLLCLFSTNPHDGVTLPSSEEQNVTLRINFCGFAPAKYYLDVAVTEPAIRIIEECSQIASFTVHPKMIGGHWAYEERFGDFFPAHTWETMQIARQT